MPLDKIALTAETLRAASGFDCGDQHWARDISDWLKDAGSGALADMQAYGTRVWLYKEGDRIVGVGSVGVTWWRWPQPDGPRRRVAIIPNVAVDRDFQRRAMPEGDATYATRILLDLVAEATDLCRDEHLP